MEWVELTKKYGAILLLYARQWTNSRAEAEEAVQNGFIRLWRSGTWKTTDIKDALPHLYMAVKRSALDALRSSKRRATREKMAGELLYKPYNMFESKLEDDERRKEIEGALDLLSQEQKEVLIMKIWGDMTFKAIGRTLEISTHTAASRYRYALKALRQHLDRGI